MSNNYRLVSEELPEPDKPLWLFWDTGIMDRNLELGSEIFEVGYYGLQPDEDESYFYCKEIDGDGDYYDVKLVQPTHWKYAEYPEGVEK